MKEKIVKSLSHVQLFATLWTIAHQVPLSMRFSRQEYWSGLPFPSLGYLNVLLCNCQVIYDSGTSWPAACQNSLFFTVSWSLLKLTSIESVVPSNHLILCRPLLLLPSVIPSIRVFSNESALPIRWPKYWSFSFSMSPSNEYAGLISFRMDWLDLLSVQETLKILSSTTIWKHQFFCAQLSLWSNSDTHTYLLEEP